MKLLVNSLLIITDISTSVISSKYYLAYACTSKQNLLFLSKFLSLYVKENKTDIRIIRNVLQY